MIKNTFVWSFRQFRSMPWGRWGLRFAILSQTILPLFVSAPLHPPVINRFSNIITYISKRINDIEPRKGCHTCFFAGLAFRNYRSFRSGQLLEMLSQTASRLQSWSNTKNLTIDKLLLLSGSNSQCVNPGFPLPLNNDSPSRKGRGIFAVLFANFWPTIQT